VLRRSVGLLLLGAGRGRGGGGDGSTLLSPTAATASALLVDKGRWRGCGESCSEDSSLLCCQLSHGCGRVSRSPRGQSRGGRG
jgi:hypothetical protein